MSLHGGHFIHFFCGYTCEEVWNYRWTTWNFGNLWEIAQQIYSL